MTDRAALADRLEALIRDLRFDDGKLNNIRVATFVRFHDVDILAALREPGSAALASDASVIDKYADLQAVLDDAHKRGAEAMREAAAHYVERTMRGTVNGWVDISKRGRETASAIRALPLPEPKP